VITPLADRLPGGDWLAHINRDGGLALQMVIDRDNMHDRSHCSILVLDAMGMIYQATDDVAELLVPFVREKAAARILDGFENTTSMPAWGRRPPQIFGLLRDLALMWKPITCSATA